MLDTTGCARILRGADQAGHIMEVDMQRHPHQIVSINFVAFIKLSLDVQLGNFQENKCFKEVVENFKKKKIWGFESSMDHNLQRVLSF